MKQVQKVRRELRLRTMFNLLGPLTNPAGATRQLIGVSDARFLDTVAGALVRLGAQRALVVSGEDGLDEVSIAGATHVVEVVGECVRRYTLRPEDVGLASAPDATTDPALAGGEPQQNAEITRAILAGELAGAAADLALINAGAAIYAAGVADTLADGVQAAQAAIATGAASRALEGYVQASQRHSPAPREAVS
jgi:anthranilate phosphoribosyltransferase